MIGDELGQRKDVQEVLEKLRSIAEGEFNKVKASHGTPKDPDKVTMGAATLSDNAIRGTINSRLVVLCQEALSLVPSRIPASPKAKPTTAMPNVVEANFGQTA